MNYEIRIEPTYTYFCDDNNLTRIDISIEQKISNYKLIRNAVNEKLKILENELEEKEYVWVKVKRKNLQSNE